MALDITGSLVALVTPMQENGDIDFPAFDRLVDWHVKAGTGAIVVVGTTGESATLTPEEHCGLVKHCVQTANGRIPVIAGAGSNSTTEAMMFTQSAKDYGADAALLVTPYYNKPPQEGLYQHFATIAEAVDLPQILYNVPGRTACDLHLDTVRRLAKLKNIVAIKDATGDLQRGIELVRELGEELAVYSGEDSLTLPLMLAGAKGTISVTANVAPEQMARMCAAALAGDEAAATAADEKLAGLHENLFLQANPIPVKWALQRMQLIGSHIRLPMVVLDTAYHEKVEQALRAAEITLPEAA